MSNFKNSLRLEGFNSIKIRMASEKEILSWSYGEVTKPETINYRTQKPEKDGLFCEKIFGPTRDYECYCGKYRKIRYKGVICDKCGVEVTKSSVRRERMGHIKLATPVCHIWFLRGVPSRLGLLLGKSMQEIEKVIYFIDYIITEVNEEKKKRIVSDLEKNFKKEEKKLKRREEKKGLKEGFKDRINEIKLIKKGNIIPEVFYRQLIRKYGEFFQGGTGTEAIKKILEGINLKTLEKELKERFRQQKEKNILQRIRLINNLINSGVRPESFCLTSLPVLPPDLRPMVQLDGGKYASSDLNDLYRRVINRNNRLKYLKEINAPEIIIRNEKRMLQEAVDALIDNQARKIQTPPALAGKRKLKSLADILRGKQGRFRQNLLGKRVDYSGRSVIVVGPDLSLDEVGIPKKLALELFKPFIINKILERKLAYNIKGANILISEGGKEIWEILEEIIKDKYVLLNRAPTLHRLSIQAFYPILIEDEAIQIHPLVCPAFNADFDGDQMAVHLPLSKEAQQEAKNLMISTKGVLKPATGQPIAIPRQDMVLGCYYLTTIREKKDEKEKVFSSFDEAKLAYESGNIDLQEKIKVKLEDEQENKFIETSAGQIIFNEILPPDFPYQSKTQNSRRIQELVFNLIKKYGEEETVKILDKIKDLGFEYATLSSITWGIDDLIIPKEKEILIKEANKKEEEVKKQYLEGFLSDSERKIQIIEIWQQVKDEISKMVPKTLPSNGSVFSIIDAGARGSWSQPVQMAGMKGLVTNPKGEAIELPIKYSYKEGLPVLEYFISTHGARKGTVDTALLQYTFSELLVKYTLGFFLCLLL